MSNQDRKIILVTGGIRSGKSRFAQELVSSYNKVRYIATAEAKDEEMIKRIKLHQQNRPKSWLIEEEPLKLATFFTQEKYKKDSYISLIDCITMWVANLLFQKDKNGQEYWETKVGLNEVEKSIDDFLSQLKKYPNPVVIVTNEVGWGGIQINPLGRIYQDILGWTNQKIASTADEVYLVVSGIPVSIKRD